MTGSNKKHLALLSFIAASAAALVVLSVNTAAITAAERASTPPGLAGISLGMTRAHFLMRYPEAQLAFETPQIHCFGQLLKAEESERASASWKGRDFWLAVKFHRAGSDLRLNSVEVRTSADFSADAFPALRAALVARHGPYSRLLIPAKLDAARLLIGFEWSRKDSTRSYRIHRDTHGSGNGLFVTQRLTSWLPGSDLQIAADRRQREIYGNLRQRCAAGRG